ncbi:LysM peptidoglycan-binding domain-containing protein [Zhouia sp. PK063]|uniref:lytic transglycosylase domain-containing protein n=1 Tax=Zhouia sp. PK063 TaxID=3373602 RepID=UPI00379E7FAA
MKKLLIAVFSLSTILMYAQDKKKKHTKEETDSLQTAKIDTTHLQQDEVDQSLNLMDIDSTGMVDGKGQVMFFRKQNGKFNLKDDPQAQAIDSLWMQELYNSSLFDDMYATVSNLDYDDTIAYDELPTDTLKARLKELNAKTPFNIAYNPSLESVIKMFLKHKRKYFERIMSISEFYFPMFEQVLDNYDIPLEMKYLAVVESALNPKARSRVGATGLWQFMFSTGRQFGLDVNSYVDERSDPLKSTEAACKYLSALYNVFGDWDLALAAYNSGPGNVTKAIRRSGGYKNYWNLRPYLPRETAGYVPAFYATMYLFEYAKEHGFTPKKPQNIYFETDTIHMKKLITFEQISKVTNIDMEELQFFNPSYKLDIVPFIKDKKYALRLPISDVGKFVSNEDSIYAYVDAELAKREKPLPELLKIDAKIRYRVRNGDYLGRIANKFGVRVSQIKRWNGLRNNNLRAGQRLTIYPRKVPASPKVSSSKKSSYSSSTKVYTVQNGDSLWSISKKFPGISIENIKEWNDISGNKLKPGMKLKMCSC